MGYLLTFLAALLTIALGENITLFGGAGFYLPALLILAASYRKWRLLLLILAALLLVHLFSPFASATVALLVAICSVSYFFFLRLVDEQSPTMTLGVTSLLLGIFVVVYFYLATRSIGLFAVGSFLLTFPVLVVWSFAGQRIVNEI